MDGHRNRVLLARNPYYHFVDTASNQLPYADRLEISHVDDKQLYAADAGPVCRGHGAALQFRRRGLRDADDPYAMTAGVEETQAAGHGLASWPSQRDTPERPVANVRAALHAFVVQSHPLSHSQVGSCRAGVSFLPLPSLTTSGGDT